MRAQCHALASVVLNDLTACRHRDKLNLGLADLGRCVIPTGGGEERQRLTRERPNLPKRLASREADRPEGVGIGQPCS